MCMYGGRDKYNITQGKLVSQQVPLHQSNGNHAIYTCTIYFIIVTTENDQTTAKVCNTTIATRLICFANSKNFRPVFHAII